MFLIFEQIQFHGNILYRATIQQNIDHNAEKNKESIITNVTQRYATLHQRYRPLQTATDRYRILP